MAEKPTYEELEKKIQELEQIESLMIKERNRAQQYFDVAEVMLICLDRNQNVTQINKRGCKILGYTANEVIGKNWFDNFLPKKNIKKIKKLFGKMLTGEKVGTEYYENLILAKSGNEKIISWHNSIIKDDSGHVISIITSGEDITEKKTAEYAMRLMKYGVDRASDCIYWMNSKARLIYVNNAACNLLGYSYEELISMNLNQFDPNVSLDAWPDRLAELKKLESSRFESQHKTRDGRLIPVEVTSSYVLFEGEEGIFSFARDITQRKKTEEEKINARKIITDQKRLALVGQIAGRMAHDFNNILAVIMGNAQLSLQHCKEAKTIETLKLIFNQTIRGKNLTKNLVVFAKNQEPKQEFFRLSEKIDLVFKLLKKDLQGIELIRENKPGTPDLLADPGMIEHALVNLVQNSIHATSMVERPRIIIRTFHKNRNIYLEIEDNGCGIPEEAIGRIYEPAFTMKGGRDITGSYKPGIKGTGYGMANVKKYIQQHKGNISVDSKVGKGTKITISIPVIKRELTEKEIVIIKKKNFSFGKHILLVEDEQAISNVQYKILTHEPCNHKVDIATNGKMAVDLFGRNKYDIISLDYMLSGELNGMDVYNHIRHTNDTLPILFVSGNLDFLESIKELKNKDPYIDHMSKPCQNKDYVNGINELLGKI